MVADNLEKIAYVVNPSKEIAFSTKRIGVNFVPRGRCTNRCVFCEPNISSIKAVINHDIVLDRDYSVEEMLRATLKVYEENSDCSEIFISGTIGEPLLYFDKLAQLISQLKRKIPLPIRLNSNGQATIINSKYSSFELCERLQEAGLDSVVVSLNAVNERDYNLVCKPKLSGAFESVLDFIRASVQSKIETFVSFVDYPRGYLELPVLDKSKIKYFCKNELGVKDSQIIYRPLISSIQP